MPWRNMLYIKRASLAAIALTATAGPRLARSRRSCAPKYVLLAFKELAAIFKSLSQTILRRSPAFADDFIATDAVVRRKPQPGNKMVCRWPGAHVVARFGYHRHRRNHINAVDPG